MRRSVQRLGVAVMLALVVAAPAIHLLASGGHPATPAPAAASPTAMLRGVPQHGAVLGDPRAPVTLTEFADLQCPFCRAYAEAVLPTLVRRYVRTGRLRLVFRPLAFIGPDSVRAARLALAAGRQDRLWQVAAVLYARQGAENSGYVTTAFLREAARAAGADPQRALAQAGTAQAGGQLAAAAAEARRFGVTATPSFLLRVRGGPARRLVPTSLTVEAFSRPIDAALRAR